MCSLRWFPMMATLIMGLFGLGCGDSETPDATGDTTTSTTTTGPTTTSTITTTTGPATTTSTSTTTTMSTSVLPDPPVSTVEELLALDRPVVAAHAGGDQDYPHSTLYAFEQAAHDGADLLEMDVQLTADGVLIVQHDDTVDRTTETTGRVAEMTLAEIQALDNAYWFIPGNWDNKAQPDADYRWRGVRTGDVEAPPGFTPDDFAVPTFRQVAERFTGWVLNVEIKVQRNADGEDDPATGIAAAEVLAREIDELGIRDSVIVASFNDEVLDAFRTAAPEVATSPGENAMLARFFSGTPLHPNDRVVQIPNLYQGQDVALPGFFGPVQDDGYAIWVWFSGTGVEETTEMYTELFSRGINGVIAGRPAAAVAALQSRLAVDSSEDD